VLGDKTYGSGYKASASKLTPAAQTALTNLDRQALHAAELAFVHPASGKRLSFISDLPTDMARLVAALAGTRTDPKQRAKQASAKARLANRPRGRST
jgi:23S rRNA pseudouridine1911/1915/1917 synthase